MSICHKQSCIEMAHLRARYFLEIFRNNTSLRLVVSVIINDIIKTTFRFGNFGNLLKLKAQRLTKTTCKNK